MTDSSTDTQSADSGFDVGSSVDDLFGEIGSDAESDGDRWTETDDGEESDAVEDQTAADVFDQLRTDAGDENDADDILADESPDDIIASADEPDPEPDAAVDADLLADDDELADLLLTGRSKETDGEFLWIDPDADDAGTDDSDADAMGTDGSVTGDEGALEASADTTTARESGDVAGPAEQPDAAESVTGDTDVDGEVSPANDTGEEAETATLSTTESSSGAGLETISDSSDDTETDEIDEADSSVDANQSDDVNSDLEGDDTASEPATDGDDGEADSDRTEANDGSAGLLAKVRDILSGLF